MASTFRTSRIIRSDWGLVYIVLMLLVIGLIMVYSASYWFSLVEGGPYEGRPTYFVKRQILFALVGFACMFVFSRIDYHLYRKYAVHILVATLMVLIPMVVVGRWIMARTNSVQPSEFAKIGAIIYIAVWLASKGDDLRNIRLGLVPFALLLGFIAGLIVLQPNYSTALLLVVTATAMFFAAGVDMKQLLIYFLFGGVAMLIVGVLANYRLNRIDVWLKNPFTEAQDRGFQTVQTLIALHRGGWLGVGLAQSQQKYSIYACHTDGIFAIIAEEWGFIGGLIILGLYGLWLWRGLRIALRAPDTFGMLLAVGLVGWYALQALLHIAVNTASTPYTGTVLPFISSGGSSLITGLAAVGILLNISRSSPRAPEEALP